MTIYYGKQITIEVLLHDEDIEKAAPIVNDAQNGLIRALLKAGCKDAAIMSNGRIPIVKVKN